jgi:hypothetical protein
LVPLAGSLHSFWPAAQPHVEFVQAAPGLQALPHPPQLFGSFVVLTHAAPPSAGQACSV